MNPRVGIIMGSDSDLPVMQEAAKVLEELGVPAEVSVVSAHRTPERMVEYAQSAEGRGIQVVIAGAGGAAHLPGMVASLTLLPVVGVPIRTSSVAGVDSLFSIAQMPPGVPVATVAINGARNAGILAAQIIGATDSAVRARVSELKNTQKENVLAKDADLQKDGFRKYLEDNGLL